MLFIPSMSSHDLERKMDFMKPLEEYFHEAPEESLGDYFVLPKRKETYIRKFFEKIRGYFRGKIDDFYESTGW